jgi:hypothetical protein
MKITVKLKKTTKPKFMHNAEKAGKLPVWTFEFTDDSKPKKTGEVDITMTKAMTKSEKDAKKLMAEAAKARIEKEYPDADVTVVSNSMSVGDD